jgi:hypothetical protein
MPPQPSTSQPPTSGITSFFRLLGLLKYGLVLSVALAYLPFTTYRPMPLHGMLGNLFSELRPLSAFSAMLFVLLAAWTVMIVTGLIVTTGSRSASRAAPQDAPIARTPRSPANRLHASFLDGPTRCSAFR